MSGVPNPILPDFRESGEQLPNLGSEHVSQDPREITESIFENVRTSVSNPNADKEALVEIVGTQFESLSQAIISSAEQDTSNNPALVRYRIIKAYQGLSVEQSRSETTKVPSINGAVGRYQLNLARIRDLKLNPYDEMSLLKSAALAGLVRDTEAGARMHRSVVSMLRHEITNIVSLGRRIESQDTEAFIRSYETVVFASQALNEIADREGSTEFTSIDDCLLKWAGLEQRTTENDTMIPNVVIDEEPEAESIELNKDEVQFRRLTEAERNERLNGLMVIGKQLPLIFGEDCQIEYYETIIFDDPLDEKYDRIDREEQPRDDEESDDVDERQLSGGLFKDYIIVEVTEHLEDGTTRKHVIGESINPDNACYVLRGDLADEVSKLVGEQMEWRDFFKLRKNGARQMGVRDFRHKRNGNLPARVVEYLSTNIDIVKAEFAAKFTDIVKAPFDRELEQTAYNRLPKTLKQKISSNKENGIPLLDTWRKVALDSRLGLLGRTILSKESDSSNILDVFEVEDMRQELASALGRITQLEDENGLLRSKINRLRAAFED